MSARPTKVLVVGGGAVGAATAYFCARQGLSVVLVDNPRRGRATSASAGGLWPLGESLGLGCGVIFHRAALEGGKMAGALPREFLDFSLTSNAMFPELAKELQRLTTLDIEYQETSLLFLVFTDADDAFARHLTTDRAEEGALIDWVDAKTLGTQEPSLSKDVRAALRFRGDDQVNPYRLADAFVAGARALGAKIMSHTDVQRLIRKGDRVIGAEIGGAAHHADVVINAAGAWARELAATADIELPVDPVRGQIVCTETLPKGLLKACISTSDCYFLQKAHGEIIIGSTTEEVGFDPGVTDEAVAALCRGATRAMPMLENVRVKRVWSGLRPGSPDELPILGEEPGVSGYLHAAGHFRTGIVNAPLTGLVLAERVLGQKTTVSLEPFSNARFRRKTRLAASS